MNTGDDSERFEYPDAAGYPDGSGTLDEGTAALVDEVTADALRAVDTPSEDADAEIEVRRDDERGVFAATLEGREIATIRYDLDGDRITLITTTVQPEFRGRGIATDLIADALDDLREQGTRFTVLCPVVAAFIAGNPEYAGLADAGDSGA
ncbi:GNAT family N-acetyltransferase [Agromyces mariniharenae]|nr:GNAT family N-acetyltransferase [Agromyces mariniharenae]